MSAPTPISQQPSDIAVEFNGLAPAVIGPVNRKAAPASHAHAMNALGRVVKGFGVALDLSNGGGTLVGGIGSRYQVPSLAQFCIEFWAYNDGTTDYNGPGLGCFAGLQTLPISGLPTSAADSVVGWTGAQNDLPLLWPDGTYGGDPNNFPFLQNQTGYHHWAISGDGTTVRAFADGKIQATQAQSGPVAGYLNIIDYDTSDFHVDEVRLSSTARYTADFTVPTEPFVNDEATLILWSFDDLPLGEIASASSTTEFPDISADSSGNGNTVDFVSDGATATGLISTVTSASGVGTAYSVLSLQGQRGDLELTDTSGNSVATAVPQSDGTVQLQMAGLSGGATPWTSVPYWLARVD